MDKHKLRQVYKEKRRNLSLHEKEKIELGILDNFKSLKLTEKFNNFHIFLSISYLNEINTKPIIKFLRKEKKNIIIPKIKNKELQSCLFLNNSILETNDWGIKEPKECNLFNESEIEVIITPLLICDTNGNRIGYGGGFYDKLFTKCPNAIKLGINFFEPITLPFETYPTDVPLDLLITKNNIIKY